MVIPGGTDGSVVLVLLTGMISVFLKLMCSPSLPAADRMASVVSAILVSFSSSSLNQPTSPWGNGNFSLVAAQFLCVSGQLLSSSQSRWLG